MAMIVPTARPGYGCGLCDSLPLGRADFSGNRGYIATASGVEAIDLGSGKTLWTNRAASAILLVLNDRIVARSAPLETSVRLLFLSREKGSITGQSEPLTLPGGVRAAQMKLQTRRLGDALEVFWEAEAGYRGGAAPPPSLETHLRVLRGQFRVDPATGAVTAEPIKADPLGAASGRESFEYMAGAEWRRAPWRSGDAFFIFERNGSQPPALLLRRLPTGPVRELVRIPDPVATVTADGCYVLVHSATGNRDWRIFSVTGESVGAAPYETGAFSPGIGGGRIYYLIDTAPQSALEPSLVFKALDLRTRRIVWERAVLLPAGDRARALRQ